MKNKIEVSIKNIKVSKNTVNGGYFSFDWVVSLNSKRRQGRYDSSYSGQSASAMRGKLKRWYAVQLAVENYFN